MIGPLGRLAIARVSGAGLLTLNLIVAATAIGVLVISHTLLVDKGGGGHLWWRSCGGQMGLEERGILRGLGQLDSLNSGDGWAGVGAGQWVQKWMLV